MYGQRHQEIVLKVRLLLLLRCGDGVLSTAGPPAAPNSGQAKGYPVHRSDQYRQRAYRPNGFQVSDDPTIQPTDPSYSHDELSLTTERRQPMVSSNDDLEVEHSGPEV